LREAITSCSARHRSQVRRRPAALFFLDYRPPLN
jgi:hypothetical protein